MSWQQEIAELVVYGRRIGLDFDDAWDQAVECVRVPPMDQRSGVLAFFKVVCARSWQGEEVAPPGCFDTTLDSGGVSAIGKARGRSKG